jgi:hypothetical protein
VRRIGFRTVALVQKPIATAARVLLGQQSHSHPQSRTQDQTQSQHAPSVGASAPTAATAGESFYFSVNGVPVFAKGANLIPLHVLSTAVSEGSVRALLQSAVDANMNMIRIWGGGRYQVSVGVRMLSIQKSTLTRVLAVRQCDMDIRIRSQDIHSAYAYGQAHVSDVPICQHRNLLLLDCGLLWD